MCACYLHNLKKNQPSAARAVQGHDFLPPLGILPMGAFLSFPPRGGLPSWGISNGHDDDAQKNCPNDIFTVICIFPQNPPNPVFFEVSLHVFCNAFLQNTVIYTFVAIKPFQNILFYNVSNSLVSPNPWKHRYLHCFLQFYHVPMPLANSNIYTN